MSTPKREEKEILVSCQKSSGEKPEANEERYKRKYYKYFIPLF